MDRDRSLERSVQDLTKQLQTFTPKKEHIFRAVRYIVESNGGQWERQMLSSFYAPRLCALWSRWCPVVNDKHFTGSLNNTRVYAPYVESFLVRLRFACTLVTDLMGRMGFTTQRNVALYNLFNLRSDNLLVFENLFQFFCF